MAAGILDIVNARMADAIRTITIRRGIDPRDFALFAYGGAGPMHAVALAEELEIGEVVIPVHPGAFSAWGMLQTEVKHELKQTFYGGWDAVDPAALEDAYQALETRGRAHLLSEGVPAGRYLDHVARLGVEQAFDQHLLEPRVGRGCGSLLLATGQYEGTGDRRAESDPLHPFPSCLRGLAANAPDDGHAALRHAVPPAPTEVCDLRATPVEGKDGILRGENRTSTAAYALVRHR